MDDNIIDHLKIGNANIWWNSLPAITKIAIYEDLCDIMEHEVNAG